MNILEINLELYTYDLPDERIAKFPLPKRDESKLQVYRQGEIIHTGFKAIGDFLPEESLLVFNNTKVIPARLLFPKTTGAVIQIFLLHPVLPTPVINLAMNIRSECVWECMIGNRKRWKLGDSLEMTLQIDGKEVEVKAEWFDDEKSHVKFSWQLKTESHGDIPDFLEIIQAFGQIPLPPYLNRETTEEDLKTYQTVYSEKQGAVAAPTAGLHFTEEVLQDLSQRGIRQDFLTLHVGAGTFQPIKVKNILEHKMHNEQLVFSRKNIETLLQNIGNIIPVGTTSMRALESLYWYGVKLLTEKDQNPDFFIEKLYPYQYGNNSATAEDALHAILNRMIEDQVEEITGETEIFIFPGYVFKLCKGIVTNYHQPESTLILLIAALIGEDWRKIYREALEKDYRFLSYGDSSLLLP